MPRGKGWHQDTKKPQAENLGLKGKDGTQKTACADLRKSYCLRDMAVTWKVD
jgi:hypothetical protein